MTVPRVDLREARNDSCDMFGVHHDGSVQDLVSAVVSSVP